MHYILSDIHGKGAAFDAILTMINMTESDCLYILGDVIDRGPDGIALLRRISQMPNTMLLLGNHEYMMLDALRHPGDDRAMIRWWNNGCEETFRRFCELGPQAREELLLFLESLPVQLEMHVGEKNYILVHAAPTQLYRAGKWRGEREFAVWQRFPMASLPQLAGRTILIGHTPTSYMQYADWPKMRIAHCGGVIDLDCGCVFSEHGGQLGCLRLEDGTEFYSEEGVVTAPEAAAWRRRYVDGDAEDEKGS